MQQTQQRKLILALGERIMDNEDKDIKALLDRIDEVVAESATIPTIPIQNTTKVELQKNINVAKMRIQTLKQEISALRGKITLWKIQLERL